MNKEDYSGGIGDVSMESEHLKQCFFVTKWTTLNMQTGFTQGHFLVETND